MAIKYPTVPVEDMTGTAVRKRKIRRNHGDKVEWKLSAAVARDILIEEGYEYNATGRYWEEKKKKKKKKGKKGKKKNKS